MKNWLLIEDKKIEIKKDKLRLLMDSLILNFGDMSLPPMIISEPKEKKKMVTKTFVPDKKGKIF